MHEGVEGSAVARHCEAFETLVVVAAGDCVGGDDGFVRVVYWWGVGAEAYAAVAAGDVCFWGHDCLLHSAGWREFVDVGTVFV